MPNILSAATAVPAHRYDQEAVRQACRTAFGPLLESPGREAIFDHAGVRSRALVEPIERYLSPRPFEEKNAAYFTHARELSERALRSALEKSGLDFPDIGHIISVTTTGLLTPSLEAHLAQALPFPRGVKRTPLFGSGCAGGAVALARAADFLLGRPEEAVLVLSVELCSLTFMPQEQETTQIVAAALFGDGASAVVLAGDRHRSRSRAEIVDSASELLPDSLDVMGWDFTDQGMRLVLSPRAVTLVEDGFAAAVEPFLARHGLKTGDIEHFLLHPGSAKILDACERSLGIDARKTWLSREFLAANGNLSSSSLLFILEDAFVKARPRSGSHGLMAAFGPGFSCELLLLRFS
ncbi:MAG: 3-oxoacyl-[acyl-carrier-protein] synthase III C-terminal domain-containing protein [Elusimicrobiota bacterium]|nr:3-oxoacyl-[acyl-carrier-protein] synthase III C-terminal domain-containing protein [Elusimicrobiota bacterium]